MKLIKNKNKKDKLEYRQLIGLIKIQTTARGAPWLVSWKGDKHENY